MTNPKFLIDDIDNYNDDGEPVFIAGLEHLIQPYLDTDLIVDTVCYLSNCAPLSSIQGYYDQDFAFYLDWDKLG